MKPNLKSTFCLLVLLVSNAYAQQFEAIDNAIKAYPKSFASPQKLSEKINADFTKPEEKVRAIFTWIALNVGYDLKFYYAQANNPTLAYSFTGEEDRLIKEKKFRLESAAKTLRSKKGVCQDYCALFETLCEQTGIQCVTIIGRSKNDLSLIGKYANFNDHAWNAVKFGNDWKLIDVTWAAGSLNSMTGKMEQKFNDAYFFTNPELFFYNHFPEDKKWLFVNKTSDDFAKLPLYYGGYIKGDYKFTTPVDGVYSLKTTDKLHFKAANLPENYKVGYVFTSEKILHEIPVSRNGNTSEFEVVLGKRSRGYLTIYINSESVASYKINP